MANTNTSRVATRPKNATQHPGDNEVQKRKRRTKEEMKIARQEEEAAKAAKADKERQVLQRIATLETQITEDQNFTTPRPAFPKTRSHTRGGAHHDLSPAESDNGLGPVSDSMDSYRPTDGPETIDMLSADEAEQDEPAKKKSRKPKASFRDAVKKVQAATEASIEDIQIVDNGRILKCTFVEADLAGPRGDHRDADKTDPVHIIKAANADKKCTGVIKDWARSVRLESTHSSKAGSQVSSTSTRRQLSSATAVTSEQSDKTAAGDIEASEEFDKPALGGLIDESEISGPKGEAARSSPIKGKKRVTNDNLIMVQRVVQPPEHLTPVVEKGCKYNYTHLPVGSQDRNYFCLRFITTVIWFAAFYHDCWNIFDDDAKAAFQAIWDALYGDKLKHEIQIGHATMQRIRDGWRSVIASAAISVLLDFFDSVPFNTDLDRQQFATDALEDDVFIYSNTDFENPEDYRGPFHCQLVIQTFAAHFGAIHGAFNVPALGDAHSMDTYPKGALALSAAAMERALKLCKMGAINIEAANIAKSSRKPIVLVKVPGCSVQEAKFSDANWGERSWEYMEMISDLRESSLRKTSEAAYMHYKAMKRDTQLSTDLPSIMGPDQPKRLCRRIVDLSDDEA